MGIDQRKHALHQRCEPDRTVPAQVSPQGPLADAEHPGDFTRLELSLRQLPSRCRKVLGAQLASPTAPARPSARAAFNPAIVRSSISTRSNCATAPDRFKFKRPVAPRLLITVKGLEPDPASIEVLQHAQQVMQAPRQSVQLEDDKHSPR